MYAGRAAPNSEGSASAPKLKAGSNLWQNLLAAAVEARKAASLSVDALRRPRPAWEKPLHACCHCSRSGSRPVMLVKVDRTLLSKCCMAAR